MGLEITKKNSCRCIPFLIKTSTELTFPYTEVKIPQKM